MNPTDCPSSASEAAVLAELAGAYPAPGQPTQLDPVVKKVCLAERLIGLCVYASTVLLLLGSVALTTYSPLGSSRWIVAATADGAAVVLVATVHLLLRKQVSRMERLSLGYRPWRSPASRRPVFARRFWLAFAAMALCLLFLLLFFGANLILLALLIFEMSQVAGMTALRISSRDCLYRAGCWGWLWAVFAGQALSRATAWAMLFVYGVALQGWEMPATIYCTAVGLGTALCAIGLGMGPVPLSSDGRPYERYPASVYSERMGKALSRWSAAMARPLLIAGVASTLLASLTIIYLALIHDGLGAALATSQFMLAVILIGSMIAASVRRAAVLSEALHRLKGLPRSEC
jgi:hypothetical protein